MDPFHKTGDAFNGHQHRKYSKVVDICIFFFKCMYIYYTIICIILPLNQITNKIVYANARVFLMQRLWEGR